MRLGTMLVGLTILAGACCGLTGYERTAGYRGGDQKAALTGRDKGTAGKDQGGNEDGGRWLQGSPRRCEVMIALTGAVWQSPPYRVGHELGPVLIRLRTDPWPALVRSMKFVG